MVRRLAITTDGCMTYCSASEENVGKGRCNHLTHAKDGESQIDFLNRSSKIMHLLESENMSHEEYCYLNDEIHNIPESLVVNSKNPSIRLLAAKNSIGLKKLVNDENEDVRYYAQIYDKENKKNKRIFNRYSKMTSRLKGESEEEFKDRISKISELLETNYTRYGGTEVIDKDLENFLESQYKNFDSDTYIKSKNYYARVIAAKNGDGHEILSKDPQIGVRVAVAEAGYYIPWDISDEVVEASVKNGKHLDKFIDSKKSYIRSLVAKQGYGLDKLVRNENWMVRLEVAKQGYGLDKLSKDISDDIRYEVAKQGHSLDKLVSDYNPSIRLEVAKHGYGLDKLINDENDLVRAEVARHGYGLDKLVNDESNSVRIIANYYNENGGF